MSVLKKYAQLLVHYCLELKPGEKLFVSTTTLAEPLVRELYREATKAGALVEVDMAFREKSRLFLDNANEEQLMYVSPFKKLAMETFDAYLVIRAPFNLKENQSVDADKMKKRSKASKEISAVYFERTANGSMKRSLCQYPTQASAQEAGMSLEEYQDFVFNACNLMAEDPRSEWLKVRERQQKVVDHLNTVDTVRYKNAKTDISFAVKGRTWINSDGRTNMPSGEVFTGPIEDSVNGFVHFDFPSIYSGHEVRDITLEVKDGKVVKWQAGHGQVFLDKIMEIDGARFFGEVAIGTNYSIQKATKNILFDEKIGGTIHMAIGQSYKQTGGTNQSSIHWDMIADMRDGGQIYTDGKLIYENGKFLGELGSK